MYFEYKGVRPVVHETAFVHPQGNVTGNVIIGKNVYEIKEIKPIIN